MRLGVSGLGLVLGIILGGADSVVAQGLAPQEAVARMEVADGFEVKLIASEPLVRQPVAMEFDDRGRIGVIQYLQYPNPNGLKRVTVDRFSRTTYDHVPKPPPCGPKGADRITILADTNHDGVMDQGRDFINGLNLATGLAFGHGGGCSFSMCLKDMPIMPINNSQRKDEYDKNEQRLLATSESTPRLAAKSL